MVEMKDGAFGENCVTAMASVDEPKIHKIRATKVGANAFTSNGIMATWSKEGIESLLGTGENGRAVTNHSGNVVGHIVDGVEVIDDAVYMNVEIDSDSFEPWVKDNVDKMGVSIEVDNIKLNDDNEIVNGEVTGISFTMPGNSSLCTIEDGCKVIASVDDTLRTNITEGSIDDNTAVEDDNMTDDVVSKADFDALQEKYDSLVAENDAVKADYMSAKASLEDFVAKEKAKGLTALASLIGDEAAKAYEDCTICEINRTCEAVEMYKAKVDDVEEGSGASAKASLNVEEDEDVLGAIYARANGLKE